MENREEEKERILCMSWFIWKFVFTRVAKRKEIYLMGEVFFPLRAIAAVWMEITKKHPLAYAVSLRYPRLARLIARRITAGKCALLIHTDGKTRLPFVMRDEAHIALLYRVLAHFFSLTHHCRACCNTGYLEGAMIVKEVYPDVEWKRVDADAFCIAVAHHDMEMIRWMWEEFLILAEDIRRTRHKKGCYVCDWLRAEFDKITSAPPKKKRRIAP